ncbi:uncharacterized protein LOC118416113 [Branchiostoma floridae]|uniref:Uncharacterized protein LOC118416113 n=1 Tax=Branchiostoma floridae TaxID=7739 RepID=A0A9J7L688_BRAFL|nr:uncharacterized protein LOC118416113 [Branchiostoma floridae]
MKSQTQSFRCPKHRTETTGLGYNTFVIAVGQDGFVEDAETFKEVVTNPNICGVRYWKLLLLPDITDIKAAVRKVAAKIQQVPKGQQSVFIYYHSGHGKEQGLFFSEWQEEDKLYAVLSKELRDILSGSGATKSLFILDACHASSIEVYTIKGVQQENNSSSEQTKMEDGEEEFPGDDKFYSEPPKAMYGNDKIPEGSILWASSRQNEKSVKKEKYSVFTKYILSGLQGGNCGQDNCPNCQSFQRQARDTGAVSLDLLHDYVCDHMMHDQTSLQSQTPSLVGQKGKRYWIAYTQDQAGGTHVEEVDAAGAGPDR